MTSLALACRLGAVTAPRSIPRRVRAILNKYGATMLLPGVSGVLRFGYQPGNYRESTGQTLAGADQQVGLVVDAARVPGPELRGGFVAQIAGSAAPATYNTATGAGTCNRVDVSNQSSIRLVGLLVGRRYAVSVTNTGLASVSVRTAAGAVILFSVASGATVVQTIVPQSIGDLVIQGGIDDTSCTFVVNSVRELPGIHASQSTSGFQPVLRNASGIQSWQFDGTDDRLSLSAVPFQMADDHFVVAGGNVTSLGAVTTLATPASKIGSNTRVPQLRVEADGKVRSFWIDEAGAGAAVTSAGVLVVPGQPFVATARKSGTTGVVRFNGTQQASSSLSALGATACDRGEIGAWAGIDRMNGHIHGVIFGKGAISDSELLTLERFVASMQGRSI